MEKEVKSPTKVTVKVKALKKSSKPIVTKDVDPLKDVLPSKTGVLKRLKKMAHRSRHSPERSSNFSPSYILLLPPFIVPTTSHIPSATYSPTFDIVLQQPLITLFPFQSTDTPPVQDTKTDEEEFQGSFAEIEFDSDKEKIPDHMIMSGKQFKILNRKLNYLLQFQANAVNNHSISGIEVDVMLNAQEHCIQSKIDSVNRDLESRNKEVKTVRENVNLKIQELHDDMAKEFAELGHNCSNLHNKVDILAAAITKVMEWHTTLPSQVDKLG
ncbi:unnamed protein product [Lactuca saligna]|uniref:Uncharacterized protein n=1 Tax=Lactuca saligna TaxID=75948 RepID=A0AA35Z6R0_LACSI|nr:unnamed protein product [Lactuca saligna]